MVRSGWQTLLIGVIATLAAGYVPAALLPYPINIGFAIFLPVYFALAGLIKVDVAHRGVPLLFGQRLSRVEILGVRRPDGTLEQVEIRRPRFELNEGWHWLLPRPIMNAMQIDVREQSSDIEKFVVISGNGVRMSVDASIQWRVVNLHQSLSVGEEVIRRGMLELIRQVFRSEIRRRNDEAATTQQREIRDELAHRADEKARDWGLDITNVFVSQILPSDKVVAEYENIRREELQRRAQIIELDHTRDRIREFQAMGFSPEQALETVQIGLGRVTKTIQEFKGNLTAETRDLLREIVAMFRRP